MPTLFSMVNETGNRNRILERCKFRFWLVHWIDPRSIEHNYACLFFFLLSFFFPRLISAAADWMSTIYFHTWCGLSANLRRRSETCCKRLAENTGRKKVAKSRHLGTIAQLCRAISSQLRHVSTIGKNLSSNNISST